MTQHAVQVDLEVQENKKQIGRIYSLTDPITNKLRYIGQTRLNINTRLKNHFKDRQQAKHTNNHNGNWIAKLWREFKLKPIVLLIEEGEFSDNELNDKELYWINYYLNKGYDLTNKNLNPQFRYKDWKRFKFGKTIYCYDRNLNKEVFISAREIEHAKNISHKMISQCCIRNQAYKDYVFSFSEISNKDEIVHRFNQYDSRKQKSIYAINISTGEILEFENQFQASRTLNVNFRNVNLVLKGKRKSCGGYSWIYKQNLEFERKEFKK